MSGRRGRQTGARPPSEKDLKTPKIGVSFHQQPFAPIFQQRMGGGASQGAGSQHDHVDLTGGSGESCSEDVTSSSAQNNTPTAYVKACGEATLAGQPIPTIPARHPPKPTLMEGIFQYQKTHNEELQSESLKSAVVKCFQATGITPTSSGTYKQFSFDTFKSHGNHKANAH